MARARIGLLVSLLGILSLCACDPELKDLRYRTWHDPFDTLPRGKDHPVSTGQRLQLQGILGRAKAYPRPGEGARYSPGFPPTGTAFVALNDSTDRVCECWPDRFDCKGEPELVVAKPDLSTFRRLVAAIDSEAKALDSIDRAGRTAR
jgi:hypothetical protein